MGTSEQAKEIGTILNDAIVFNLGSFKIIERKIILRHGESLVRSIWDRRGEKYVVVFALTDDSQMIFTREPKYGIWERIVGLVAGRVEKEESLIDAGKRELLEETGCISENWQIMGEPMFDFADKIAGGEHYFLLAPCCTKSVQKPEIYNDIVLVDFKEIDSLLKGTHPEIKLKTAMTQACLSRAEKYLAKPQP